VAVGVVSYMLLCWHIMYNSLNRKLSEPEDGRYKPKHVFFLGNKNHHLAIFYSCVFDWIYLTI